VKRIIALVSLLWLGAANPLCASAQSVPATQVVPAARLTALAERAAHAIVSDPDRELQATYKFTDQRVPAGELAVEVLSTQYNPSYIAIPLELRVDGKLIRTVYAGYRIVTYVKTAIAARDLAAGYVISDGDLTIGRVALNGHPTVDAASLVGRKLNVSIARGTPVYAEQTRVNELVIAGQPVIYILHDGPVAVAADVVARTGGGLGQLVAVYNPMTRKSLSGIVTGPGKVEFTLPGDQEAQ
jgi:flagella basal body P-ring formation protein FlgA